MERKQIKRSEVNRDTVTKIWRKSGNYGRLYWRSENESRFDWDRGEIAMSKHKTLRTYYQTLEAILDDCDYEVVGR